MSHSKSIAFPKYTFIFACIIANIVTLIICIHYSSKIDGIKEFADSIYRGQTLPWLSSFVIKNHYFLWPAPILFIGTGFSLLWSKKTRPLTYTLLLVFSLTSPTTHLFLHKEAIQLILEDAIIMNHSHKIFNLQ